MNTKNPQEEEMDTKKPQEVEVNMNFSFSKRENNNLLIRVNILDTMQGLTPTKFWPSPRTRTVFILVFHRGN